MSNLPSDRPHALLTIAGILWGLLCYLWVAVGVLLISPGVLLAVLLPALLSHLISRLIWWWFHSQ